MLAGQFGACVPIGAEKTASGYEIAWKVSGADQYTLWSTDANGNYIANLVGAVPGSNSVLMSSENLFQQDLNGDGQIGSGTTITGQLAGITSLEFADQATVAFADLSIQNDVHAGWLL